ncbi:antibiotic biosynthesis monooxygenase [Nonomuraea endophytica]|uniref:antibiotic biosynthesis monooxygenase n=1 Tax=Nonomuraea endophytica TaxID=714136 RepID=UPI0037CCA947
MTVGFVAYHYPRPEHLEEFVDRTRQVSEVMRSVPGFLSAGCWTGTTPDGDCVVTTGRFTSEEAFQGALTAAGDLGEVVAFDEREQHPRQIHVLHSRFEVTR